MKSVLFILAAVIITALAFLFFRVSGQAAFSILLTIAVIGLLVNSKGPKFGKCNKDKLDPK